MKGVRIIILALTVSFLKVGVGAAAVGFHNGGTGDCQGCHTIPPQLKGSDPSSTCLLCHQAPQGTARPADHYVVSDARTSTICAQLTPGGDFCWLRKNYRWVLPGGNGPGQEQSSQGEKHGHNIVAQDFGFVADSLPYAPGGFYPSSALSCISCHDPHGNYRRGTTGTISTEGVPVKASGSYTTSPDPDAKGTVGVYRLLGGKGYQLKSLMGSYTFAADPPAAVAPDYYNREEDTSETRVAYGSGMSEWCQNCHPYINSSQTHSHPAGKRALLSSEVVTNYGAYISSGKYAGANAAPYTSMVPFEMGTSDYGILKRVANSNNSNRSGPTGAANVMCLTCHRAHASGWDSMTRWNMQATFIVFNGVYPGVDNSSPPEYAQGRLATETKKTFYDRHPGKYALFQRSLCNKCHFRD